MLKEEFYNLGIHAYSGAMRVAALLNPKAKLFVEGRKNLIQKIQDDFSNNNKAVAWFHCASLGEFEQGRPVIEAFKQQFPDYIIVLTFYSPSGYEVQKNYEYADYIYYLPIDSKTNTSNFVKYIQPKIAFFVKYEFWHNYLKELKKINATIISFSTIFRSNQAFFKSKGGFQQNMLKQFDYFFTQDQNSYNLLSSININNKVIAGDTRFDRVAEICQKPLSIEVAEAFSKDTFTMVVGSSWPRDIQALRKVANNIDNLKLIVAPHEISDKKIDEIFETFSSKKGIKYSNSTLENIKDKKLLIIDNVGMLSSLYQYADIAYVGGAFGEGLHNILEPATFGIPVLFGKEYSKFNEAIQLVERQGAFNLQNEEECFNKVEQLISDKKFRLQTGNITKKYVEENLGSTKKIIDFCKEVL
ncbi:3-deoxy-D-manno-octulosonic acid transferase [Flammeovirga sp. SJP92]|uniref:3-deoxy-D-manno-octulosonic acid transferase n=1 Tax=Flammeovirga sp. SJP92 TaxID=1775430 RepID=UPI000789806A|nr:glycosyltransferase N-terminal domain-containing protein [Flammeovirga sp. SJP92]KXX70015.1 3-deoxy-D-manno-octulosonic acid transferase [Flammeovirga sp. SJP92]